MHVYTFHGKSKPSFVLCCMSTWHCKYDFWQRDKSSKRFHSRNYMFWKGLLKQSYRSTGNFRKKYWKTEDET